MGDSEPLDICMRLVLVSFTLLIMFIIIEALHDQSFSLFHLKIASETPNHQLLDQGTGIMMSQCMKLVLVSFSQLYVY